MGAKFKIIKEIRNTDGNLKERITYFMLGFILAECWYPNGNYRKIAKYKYQEGKTLPYGIHEYWNHAGKRYSKKIYNENGKMTYCIFWYPNGKIKSEYYYSADGKLVEDIYNASGILEKHNIQ